MEVEKFQSKASGEKLDQVRGSGLAGNRSSLAQ